MEEIRAILRELAVDLVALKESQKDTDKQLKELGKQIGGLGNKFGSFTEGMALPSIQRILEDQFQVTHFTTLAKAKKDGKNLEIDVLGYSNGQTNTAVAVEVKSHLKPEAVDQLLRILKAFPTFFPEHKDKKLYGLLIGVQFDDSVQHLATKKGLLVAQVADDNFKLLTPASFQPKNFQAKK